MPAPHELDARGCGQSVYHARTGGGRRRFEAAHARSLGQGDDSPDPTDSRVAADYHAITRRMNMHRKFSSKRRLVLAGAAAVAAAAAPRLALAADPLKIGLIL